MMQSILYHPIGHHCEGHMIIYLTNFIFYLWAYWIRVHGTVLLPDQKDEEPPAKEKLVHQHLKK